MNLTRNVLGYLSEWGIFMFKRIIITVCVVASLASCSKKPEVVEKPVETVVTRVVEVKRQPPIVPKTDILKLRDVNWVVVSKETADEKLEDGKAYFALDAEGYSNMSKNLNDVRVVIQQKDAVINTYKEYLSK